jgi:FixJ family two-component response regulator
VVRGLAQDDAYMNSYVDKATLEERLKALSRREREVFELLAIGFNNAQIQEKLQISLPTAKQYKSEVMRKLNLSSLAHLIALKNVRR